MAVDSIRLFHNDDGDYALKLYSGDVSITVPLSTAEFHGLRDMCNEALSGVEA